jgi:hypothetical protein
MSNYHFETPKLDLDPNFKTFFQDFYATSDTPDAHEHYAKYFTDDATLIMASKKVEGHDGNTVHTYTLLPPSTLYTQYFFLNETTLRLYFVHRFYISNLRSLAHANALT